MLAICAKDHPNQWEDELCKVCLAYNTSVHPTTGYSPFLLVYGREARLPIDVIFGWSHDISHPSPSHFLIKLKSSLSEAYDNVRARMKTQQEKQKEIYDEKVHGPPFNKGDLVWLYTPVLHQGFSRKLNHPWSGPFRVIERIADVTYRIQHLRNRRKKVVHFNRLKPCSAPSSTHSLPLLPTGDSCDSPPTSSSRNLPSSASGPFGQNLELIYR